MDKQYKEHSKQIQVSVESQGDIVSNGGFTYVFPDSVTKSPVIW